MMLTCQQPLLKAQDINTQNDSLVKNRVVLNDKCPMSLLQNINNDSLKTKAVLFIFNNSLHPLVRNEFRDRGSVVPGIKERFRMNRCTLLYIDTGWHSFHTIYQQLSEPVYFQVGNIYIARLFTRTNWPFGFHTIKKNEKGEDEEYAAVLLSYVNGTEAAELLQKMKNKEVIVNQ